MQVPKGLQQGCHQILWALICCGAIGVLHSDLFTIAFFAELAFKLTVVLACSFAPPIMPQFMRDPSFPNVLFRARDTFLCESFKSRCIVLVDGLLEDVFVSAGNKTLSLPSLPESSFWRLTIERTKQIAVALLSV